MWKRIKTILPPDSLRIDPPTDLRFTAQQDKQLLQVEDSVELASDDQHLVRVVPYQTLAANALLSQRLSLLSAVGIGEVEGQDAQAVRPA